MKKLLLLASCLWAVEALGQSSVVWSDPSDGKLYGAEVTKPGGATDNGALRSFQRTVLVWDSGTVANNVEVDSGVLGLLVAAFSSCNIVIINNAAAANRNFTVTHQLLDGSALVTPTALAIGATTGSVPLGLGINYNSLYELGWQPFPMAPRIRLRLAPASSGTGSARMVLYCR